LIVIGFYRHLKIPVVIICKPFSQFTRQIME
jgi:hypothetical protein